MKLLIGTLLVLLSGCSTPRRRVASSDQPPTDYKALVAREPSWGTLQATEEVASHAGSCDAKRIHISVVDSIDASVGETIFVDYVPRNRSALGNVIILPPTGGENFIDRIYARHLCKHGIAAQILEHWPKDVESSYDFDVHDKSYVRGLTAIRQVEHWIQINHSGPVGIIGTSVGSLYATLALETMDSIKSGVLIVAGAPLSRILAYSDLEPVIAQRNSRMKTWGFKTAADYERALKEKLQIDGLVLANNLKSKHLQQYIGLKDTTVPTDTQLALWNASGKPSGDQYQLSHVSSVVRTYWSHREDIAKFFMKEFQP